ncbi:hypothetical protein [Photobacterium satsumensis]|uniref:hypothetical protein n=1 Tax=Photobacterium satsumensis TaxID=2910239 RepID=UPI003D147F66
MELEINTLSHSQLRDAKRKAEIWWRATATRLKLGKAGLLEAEYSEKYERAQQVYLERVSQIDEELNRRQVAVAKKKPVRALSDLP